MSAGRPDYSFSRAYRLASARDFQRVYRGRARGRVGPFLWQARANSGDHPRLGLAVPRRVVKRAVDRSRLKRLIRESFRRNRNGMPPVDVVVSVRALPPDLHDPQLAALIDELWTKVSSTVNHVPDCT